MCACLFFTVGGRHRWRWLSSRLPLISLLMCLFCLKAQLWWIKFFLSFFLTYLIYLFIYLLTCSQRPHHGTTEYRGIFRGFVYRGAKSLKLPNASAPMSLRSRRILRRCPGRPFCTGTANLRCIGLLHSSLACFHRTFSQSTSPDS